MKLFLERNGSPMPISKVCAPPHLSGCRGCSHYQPTMVFHKEEAWSVSGCLLPKGECDHQGARPSLGPFIKLLEGPATYTPWERVPRPNRQQERNKARMLRLQQRKNASLDRFLSRSALQGRGLHRF